jgi:hypothetical protein
MSDTSDVWEPANKTEKNTKIADLNKKAKNEVHKPSYAEETTTQATAKKNGRISRVGTGIKRWGSNRKNNTIAYAKTAGGGAKKYGVQAGRGAYKYGGIAWRNKGQYARRGTELTSNASEAAANFGYALPGPFKVFTLAWRKMTTTLKALTILVFALAILFVPWGVFYYTGWAVGAAFMFLVSLLYWVTISAFNGIANVLVAVINAITRILMSAIIAFVEWVTGFFTGTAMKSVTIEIGGIKITRSVSANYWTQGHEILENSLISYDQIASVPSLMTVVTPEWQGYFNDTIAGHILDMFGVQASLAFLSDPVREFYTSLEPMYAMAIGCCIVAIPVILLAIIYYRNSHNLAW